MGTYLVKIPFSVTIRDSQHWTPENLEAAKDCTDYDDWAANRLEEVMRAAGQAFVDANPDVYRHLV